MVTLLSLCGAVCVIQGYIYLYALCSLLMVVVAMTVEVASRQSSKSA